MTVTEQALTIPVSDKAGSVSALLQRPADARALFVFGHGAGAGMRHAFMDTMAARLHGVSIATLRYQFPYMERGSRRPDPKPWLLHTVRAALETGSCTCPDLPLWAGGKSMGGRMTSHIAADTPPQSLRGLVYLGFPLHPAGKDGIERAAHLSQIPHPMLFIQGTRDKLATMPLIEGVVSSLGEHARMHVVQGGDHSFAVLKRSGRTPEAVIDEITAAIAGFIL